ncbi:hypothetical protein SLEP1_g18293 [Rubroshorea leprosula]|uniref:Uncharacterized protein n=1 Tax=Rubroshorea leprosula TaxID=152421 RepID=A0AAV5J679_9ROSI|nr:hypothetical protein SLEP1_g18293 [Rubroshorea leprosula]
MCGGAIIADFISHMLTTECLLPDLEKKPGSKPGWGTRHVGAIISDFIPCKRVKKAITADYLWPDLEEKPAGSKPGSGKRYSKPVIDSDDDFEIEFQEFQDEESDMDDFDDDIDDVLADIKPFAFPATAKLPSRVSREMDAHFERARELKRKREEEPKDVRKGKRPASADDDTPPRPSMTGAPPGGFMSDGRKTTRRGVTDPVTQPALFSPAGRLKTREAAHNRNGPLPLPQHSNRRSQRKGLERSWTTL